MLLSEPCPCPVKSEGLSVGSQNECIFFKASDDSDVQTTLIVALMSDSTMGSQSSLEELTGLKGQSSRRDSEA